MAVSIAKDLILRLTDQRIHQVFRPFAPSRVALSLVPVEPSSYQDAFERMPIVVRECAEVTQRASLILKQKQQIVRRSPLSAPLIAVPGCSLADRVMKLLERVHYRRADTAEEREAIFRLRYAAYRREDAIPHSPTERFSDALDHTDNAWIFGIYVDGELASSIRLHVADLQRPLLPALSVFSDLLSLSIAAGKTIVDPTRFVTDRAAFRRDPELCYVTTRLAVLASEYFKAHLLLATVRAEHHAFYRRVFGHRVVCEPRHCPPLTKPISLMALDYPLARERLMMCAPFFRSTVFERRLLFARGTPALAVVAAA